MISLHKFILISLLHVFFCISYANSGKDTLLIHYYLQKADSLCSIHPDSALTYSQKAVNAAPYIDIPFFLSKIYKTQAKVYFFKSFYDSSAYFLKKAIEHVPENEARLRSRLYDNFSAISMMQNNFDTSLYYLQLAYNINRKHNFKGGLLNNYANFGSLFRRFGAYDISMRYIYEGLPIAEELNDTSSILKFLQTIGITYHEMNNDELSNKYCKQAFDYALATKNYKRASELANSIAEANKGLKDYNEAIRYYRISYNYARMVNFHAMEAVSLLNIADYFNDKNQLDSARYYLLKVYDITQKYNYLNINTAADILYGRIFIKTRQFDKASKYLLNAIEGKYKGESKIINSAYFHLSELYEAKGDYAKAYKYYKIYSQRNDSTLNKQKAEEIANMRMQYELNKKLEQLEAEAKEKEAEILAETKRNKLIRNITIIGCFIMLIIALLAIVIFRYRQKHKLVSLKNEINSYRQRLMAQQMNPHFIFNTLNSIQYFINQNKKEESMQFVSQFAQLMRLNLYNSQNDIISLNDEIEALKLYLELERIRLDNKFDYTIEIDPAIDIKTQLVPSFLIQPIVENSIKHGILKHGQRGNIMTRIIQEKDSLVYRILDNGIGFAKSKASQKDRNHTSYGLELTKKRILLIGILNSKQTGFKFADIKERNGECIGAKVELIIPSLLQSI